MSGKLFIVSTPIGNSGDITDRARQVLRDADIIAAEDTRTTQRLLKMLGIENKTVSNHKFNERTRSQLLISRLEQGEDVAIVSDAGTPCISDPGYIIVSSAVEKGIEVIGVCGASSVVTALSVSGFQIPSYAFYGFFPRKGKDAREALCKAGSGDVPVSIFFESPMRIKKTLGLVAEELPGSEVCLCNDLTKQYERIYRGSPQSVLDELLGNPAAEKGEYTLVLRVSPEETAVSLPGAALSHEAEIIDHIVKNGGTIKDAVSALQEKHKGTVSKKALYNASLALKRLFCLCLIVLF